MLSSMEGNMHHLNERPLVPFVLDAESGFVFSTPLFFTYPLGKLGLAFWKKGPKPTL
jgi:hypothetical protein